MNFSKATFLASYGRCEQIPLSTKPEIVFSGKSNVGKSSLINAIFNRKSLAKTSSSPGKTGTVNFYEVDTIHFVDVPGYGYSKVGFKEKKRWKNLVEGYFTSNRKIALVVQILDIRHKPTDDDQLMMDFLSIGEFNHVIALTKADKLSKLAQDKQIAEISSLLRSDEKILVVSSKTKQGIDRLKLEIENFTTP